MIFLQKERCYSNSHGVYCYEDISHKISLPLDFFQSKILDVTVLFPLITFFKLILVYAKCRKSVRFGTFYGTFFKYKDRP